MTEPRRLLDDAGTSDLQRLLLGSLADEAPRPEARERTLAALGLPAAALGAVTAGAAPKAAATTGLKWLTWTKWGGALVALSIAGGTAYVVTAPGTFATHASSAGPAIQQPRIQEPTKAGGPATPTANAATTTRIATGKPPTKALPSTPVQRTAGTLMEELSLVEHARQAFAHGSHGEAVRAASTYETTFPHGSFVQEAEFIRVRSLYARRDPTEPNGETGTNGLSTDAAARAARAFLTQYPSSPYAPRVRSLLGGGP